MSEFDEELDGYAGGCDDSTNEAPSVSASLHSGKLTGKLKATTRRTSDLTFANLKLSKHIVQHTVHPSTVSSKRAAITSNPSRIHLSWLD